MRFPTGGKAHEPQGMIRCDSEADSIVWMKEENRCRNGSILHGRCLLWFVLHPGAFYMENFLIRT